jgi:hypothetical protein
LAQKALDSKGKGGSMESLKEREKAMTSIPVGNARPHFGQILRWWQLPPDREQIIYNIHIFARNGNISQRVKFQRVNKFWAYATKVSRSSPDPKKRTVLHEYVDEECPRDPDGNVQW